jgi:hypothetical protein
MSMYSSSDAMLWPLPPKRIFVVQKGSFGIELPDPRPVSKMRLRLNKPRKEHIKFVSSRTFCDESSLTKLTF